MAYKEKDTKKWTAQWFETNARGEKKKRRKRGFETKREALEYERQKKLNNSRSMDMKLSEFMEVYFEDKQNELKERTMKNKRYMMEQHIIPYFGNQMMSEITAGQIIQWQNEMQTKGFSEAYLRMIQNQLTSLFTHASRIYDLHTNPCKKVKRMGSSDNRSLDFWTVDEYQKFIQTMEPGSRYYLIFEILFWTGCRIGEMLALTKSDIDFTENRISISKTYYRTERKDVITTPKTEQSVRVIDIPQFLTQEIKDYVDKLYELPDDERIFPIVAEAVQHKLKHNCEKTGVKKIRVHDIRHPYVKHTTKIFSLRLMDFQAQAYPDARRKTRGACQLLRVGQSRSPVRPLCNRKRFSCLPPQSKMSWILYAISMRLSGYTSTRSISSSASSVVSVSASKIALDASLRLSCRACSSCFCFACANTTA